MVTDGEFRRGSYRGRFVERIDGFGIRPAALNFRDDDGHEADFTAPYAARQARRRTRPLALDEFNFIRDVTKVTPKITLPSPSTMHFYRCTDFADPVAYGDAESFFADLTPHLSRGDHRACWMRVAGTFSSTKSRWRCWRSTGSSPRSIERCGTEAGSSCRSLYREP